MVISFNSLLVWGYDLLRIKRRSTEIDQTVTEDLCAWTSQTFAHLKRRSNVERFQWLLLVVTIVAGVLVGIYAVLPESSRNGGLATLEPTLQATEQLKSSRGRVSQLEAQLKQTPSSADLDNARKQADDLRSQLAQAAEQLKSSQVAPGAGPTAVPPAPARPPTEKSPSGVDIPLMLARGDSLRGVGDIASARLFYERAANAGDGQAALRLGESYDPAFLERAQLRVPGDRALAVFWYQRARELGESKAEILLKGAQAR
jgi:hypothetical protein